MITDPLGPFAIEHITRITDPALPVEQADRVRQEMELVALRALLVAEREAFGREGRRWRPRCASAPTRWAAPRARSCAGWRTVRGADR
ncbi:MAG: hypothetical protein WKG32_13715 [Gemmatimonadaceae bacterium]